MSRTKMISTLAAGLGVLVAACWFVTATFPLAAAPQSDAAGVSVDLGGGTVMHRTPVNYPESLRAKGVHGTVLVEVKLDSTGNVTDAHAVSGPEELRKPALSSVLSWHFSRESAGQTRQVAISFQGPAASGGDPAEASRAEQAARLKSDQQAGLVGHTIKTIAILGVGEAQRGELLARLPIHQGDVISQEQMSKATEAVRDFDEHMSLFATPLPDGSVNVAIVLPSASAAVSAPARAPAAKDTGAPERIRVGGNVQQMKLVYKPRPTYPPEAKQARIQGVVKLQATIGKDGSIQNLEVISGHPLLVPAALEAVRQWVYETTLLNGNPVEVVTQIDVNFTLSQ